jgi:class 3 adenylate cyclase
MQRRLAAILAADVVGYSRLMADDEAGTYDLLRSALSEIVAPSVQHHGGEVFKTTGDGFLAAFGSVLQALEAAIAIQGLRDATAEPADRPQPRRRDRRRRRPVWRRGQRRRAARKHG